VHSELPMLAIQILLELRKIGLRPEVCASLEEKLEAKVVELHDLDESEEWDEWRVQIWFRKVILEAFHLCRDDVQE